MDDTYLPVRIDHLSDNHRNDIDNLMINHKNDDDDDESSSSRKKIEWLRSQVIGGELEIETPFGNRKLIYSDHTASGRSLHYIENYIIKHVLPFYGNTHTSESYVGRRTTKMVREAVDYIKKSLGGGLDDALLFCGSGTTAAIKRLQEVMGISVPSTLRDRILDSNLINIEERWLVFLGPYEHHSNYLSWYQSLAEVIQIGMDEDGLVDMKALQHQLELYKSSNRPMLGSFSACSNVTGVYVDTRSISRLLHEYGAFACFDFATSGPYVEIDMRSGNIDGYDAIFLSPHKFIGGPGTPGVLMLNKALYELRSSPPSTCGGGTVSYVNDFDPKGTLYYDEIEEREDAGTPPIIQKIRASMAFWVKDYIGCTLIQKKEKFFIQRALKTLLPNQNIWVLGNTSVERHSILSFLVIPRASSSLASENDIKYQHKDSIATKSRSGIYMLNETEKPLHGSFVSKLLNDLFGIQARGGCSCSGPYGHRLLNVTEPLSLSFRSAIQKGYLGVKPGWTRISFPYYMSNEEFSFTISALEFLALYGDRFLPLYSFNWKTGQWMFRKRMLTNKDKLSSYHENKHKLTELISKLSLISTQNKANDECKDNELKKTVADSSKFILYLETAKNIVDFLSDFSYQRRIPSDISQDLVYFRI